MALGRTIEVGRSPPPIRTATAGRIERRVGLAIEARDDGEDRLVEEGKGRPHLVERRNHRRPQVRGAPQQRDLLAKPAASVTILGGRDVAIREPAEQAIDPAKGDQDGPTPGLGRVGGQDRRDSESVDRIRNVGLARAGSSEPVDGRGERRIGRGLAPPPVALGSPSGANERPLLGQIDEPEVQAECPDHDLGLPGIERRQLRDEAGSERRLAAAPESDRRPPNAFDEVEQISTGLLRDHLAEERTEKPDLEGQRIAGTSRPDAGRLGADGVVRTGAWRRGSAVHAALGSAPGHVSPAPFHSRAVHRPQPSGRRYARTLVS